MANKGNEAKKNTTTLTLQELQKAQQLQKTLDAADDERKRSNTYTRFCHKIAPVFACADARTRLEGREEFDKMVDLFLEERDEKTRGKPEPSSTTYLDINKGNLMLLEGSHVYVSPKRFLIEKMNEFKKNGFNVLFMEHFFYDKQHLLDDFFKDKNKKMNPELEEHVKQLDRLTTLNPFMPDAQRELLQKYSYRAILEAAREADIRVVGIDIEDVYHSERGHDAGNKRIKYMNYCATQIIEHTMSQETPGSKYIACIGAAHGPDFAGVPGMSRLTGGTRTLLVCDSLKSAATSQTVRFNSVTTVANEQVQAGISIQVHPTQSIDPIKLQELAMPSSSPPIQINRDNEQGEGPSLIKR